MYVCSFRTENKAPDVKAQTARARPRDTFVSPFERAGSRPGPPYCCRASPARPRTDALASASRPPRSPRPTATAVASTRSSDKKNKSCRRRGPSAPPAATATTARGPTASTRTPRAWARSGRRTRSSCAPSAAAASDGWVRRARVRVVCGVGVLLSGQLSTAR